MDEGFKTGSGRFLTEPQIVMTQRDLDIAGVGCVVIFDYRMLCPLSDAEAVTFTFNTEN